METETLSAVPAAAGGTRMSELAAQYPRYGHRRIRIFLDRDGHQMGVERAYRLWRAAGLQVPRRRTHRAVSRAIVRARWRRRVPNQVWAYDFLFDQCANGQKLKCLTIVDEWTREALAIDVAGSIRSGRVIDVLAGLVSVHGLTACVRSNQGG